MKSPVPAVLGRTTRHFSHQMPQRIKELLAEFKVREQEERLVLALRQHELSNLCSTQGLVFGTGEILVGPKQKFYRIYHAQDTCTSGGQPVVDPNHTTFCGRSLASSIGMWKTGEAGPTTAHHVDQRVQNICWPIEHWHLSQGHEAHSSIKAPWRPTGECWFR